MWVTFQFHLKGEKDNLPQLEIVESNKPFCGTQQCNMDT